MLLKILKRIKIELARRVGPVMIDGYTNADGSKMKHTRYGSTTYFQGWENTVIEDYVYIAHYSIIDGARGLHIEEGCQIGPWVSILTHSSHISIRLYGRKYGGNEMKAYHAEPTRIGAYTFIGPYATVMPGSRIGKGSILYAHAYVKGEFPDFSIIAGNPAKVVGDSRDLDAPFLKEHPELQTFYDSWSKW